MPLDLSQRRAREPMHKDKPGYPYDAVDLEEVLLLQKEIAKEAMRLFNLLSHINSARQQIRGPVTAARAAQLCHEHTAAVRELHNKVAALCQACGVQD